MTEANQEHSPEITGLEWGKIEIAGIAALKDAKLWPGGGRAWDWNETGTRHEPGIQPADVEELLARGATVLVLSKGMQLRLKCCPETLSELEARGIEVHQAETTEARTIYNRLAAEGLRVGGLFHSTC